MNTLEGETVAVVGLASSGRAAAWLALEKGGEVHVSDLRTDTATHARGAELRALGAEVDLGEHPVDRIARAATVVILHGTMAMPSVENVPLAMGARRSPAG